MAFEVVMPRLGWNMEEGAVVGWRMKDGDPVAAGEILFDVESDKAVQEVEALESGILRIPSTSPPLGTQVPVGTLLAWLVKPGEEMPAGAAAAPAVTPATSAAAVPAVPAGSRTAGLPLSQAAAAPRAPQGKRIAISPRARRTASELGVDWTLLFGSGSSGRIVERDVRKVAAAGASATAVPGAPVPVTLTTEVDATDLVRLRGRLKGDRAQPAPSYDDFLAKLAADALGDHPELNARAEAGSVVRSPTVNVAIAVDTGRGPLAPVVRDVQAKSLRQVARESADLMERARAGRILPEELRGATFAIANMGRYEIDAFTPIINQPACAVLGAGRIVAKQVVTDAETGRLAIRHMVVLSLTFDHRAVDIAPAARLLQRIKGNIENPYLWLAGR